MEKLYQNFLLPEQLLILKKQGMRIFKEITKINHENQQKLSVFFSYRTDQFGKIN